MGRLDRHRGTKIRTDNRRTEAVDGDSLGKDLDTCGLDGSPDAVFRGAVESICIWLRVSKLAPASLTDLLYR